MTDEERTQEIERLREKADHDEASRLASARDDEIKDMTQAMRLAGLSDDEIKRVMTQRDKLHTSNKPKNYSYAERRRLIEEWNSLCGSYTGGSLVKIAQVRQLMFLEEDAETAAAKIEEKDEITQAMRFVELSEDTINNVLAQREKLHPTE